MTSLVKQARLQMVPDFHFTQQFFCAWRMIYPACGWLASMTAADGLQPIGEAAGFWISAVFDEYLALLADGMMGTFHQCVDYESDRVFPRDASFRHLARLFAAASASADKLPYGAQRPLPEEPYSIAMTAVEALGACSRQFPLSRRISTPNVLEKQPMGLYRGQDRLVLPERQVKQFFAR